MQTSKGSLSFLLILSALMAFTSLSTDIYLPAMPTMEKQLQDNAELTITGFLIGFAVAQLIWGPISDRIGRKIPLFVGMLLFVIGSIGCATAETMNSVIFWRVFQALGACVGPMLSRTMIRDLYSSSQGARMLSTLIMLMAVAPIAGPFIGSSLLKFSGWHAIFWLLALIGALMFVALFALPETLPAHKRAQGSLLESFANYLKLLRNRKFMLYTLSVTSFYVSNYAFITGSPFVYIDYFGVEPADYGFLFGINILGIVLMSVINRRLVNRLSLERLLLRANLIASLSALVLLGLVANQWGGIWGVLVPIFFVFAMNGIISACANAVALNSVPNQMAGSASALLGSLQYGSGIISSLLLAFFSNGSPMPMASIIASFVLLGLGLSWWGLRR